MSLRITTDDSGKPIVGGDRRIRQRLLEAAVSILSSTGLNNDLIGQSAVLAGYPLQQAQVYFKSDEDIILAIYIRLASDLEGRVQELPTGSIGDRFRAIMRDKLDIVMPFRDALTALMVSLLDPRNRLGVLSDQTEIIRIRVMSIFAAVVAGANEKPGLPPDQMVRTLYAMHLGLMLLWTQDRTDDATSTMAAVDLASDMLTVSRSVLWIPKVKSSAERIDDIWSSLAGPIADSAKTELATEILRIVFQKRRLLPDTGKCAKKPCGQCFSLHIPRVRRFLMAGEPVHFLLPSFPAKSPNPGKVLGHLPDMAEKLAMEFLQRVCEEITAIYKPGARITICSDGRVFSDLVRVSDQKVTDYGRGIAELLKQIHSSSIDMFSMEDVFDAMSHDEMRDQLRDHYATPIQTIEDRVHRFDHHRALFNGIQRFLFEDRVDLDSEKSRTRVRNECKDLAYHVIQRSDAWGRLLNECFPTALRLSIHPQDPHSEKIGMLLGDSDDNWLTPWHSVAVKCNGGFKLMHLSDAEKLGAKVIEIDGIPSYYQLT